MTAQPLSRWPKIPPLWALAAASLALHSLFLLIAALLHAEPVKAPASAPETIVDLRLSAPKPTENPKTASPKVASKRAAKVASKRAAKVASKRAAKVASKAVPIVKPRPPIVAPPIPKPQPTPRETVAPPRQRTTPIIAPTALPRTSRVPATTNPKPLPPVTPASNAPLKPVSPTIDKPTSTGTGEGNGIGNGSGNGSGQGNGTGAGNGSGNGSGDGSGNGAGNGSGDGSGNGSGDGTGQGSGQGSGDGSGNGAGKGSGEGSGDGAGKGSGKGDGQGSGTGGNGTGGGNGGGNGGGGGGGGGGKSGGGSGPYGLGGGGERARRIVYVLDVSPSMETRIVDAERELSEALHKLVAGESFNIVAFDGKDHPLAKNLLPATPANLELARKFLEDLRLDVKEGYTNGTNLQLVLRKALQIKGVNAVIVITDGEPTMGEKDFATIAAKARSLNVTKARIDCIGLIGTDSNGADNFEAGRLLQRIASDSGGQYRAVEDKPTSDKTAQP